MSLTRKIAGYTFYYGSTQMLIMAAGIISMPIFTRALSKANYGLMNIINATIFFAVILFSAGLRQALIRLHGEYRTRGVLAEALGTYLTCVLGLAVVGTLVVALLFPCFVSLDLIPRTALAAALLAAPLVFVRLAFEAISCIYRVREQVLKNNIFAVSIKYAALVLSIWLVLAVFPNLLRYYQGLLIGEAAVFAAICYTFSKEAHSVRWKFSTGLAAEMLRFGIPMMSAILTGAAMHMSNRYVIKLLIDAENVATYSVASSLATYASSAIVCGFDAALVPVIMNAWGAGQRERAEKALSNLVRYYALGAFPVGAGLIAVREGVIQLMASSKYMTAAPILPILVSGSLLLGFYPSLLIGLQFAKKTGVLALLSAAMAAVNIILTIVLIPLFKTTPYGGIMGAAVATFVCLLGYIVIGHLFARKYYTLIIPWRHLVQYALAALGMFLCVANIEFKSSIVQLIVRIPVGVIVYAALVLAMDRPLRSYVVDHLLRRKGH